MEQWMSCVNIFKLMENYSNPKALNEFVRGQWRPWSTKQVLEAVRYLALGLTSLGIKRGDFVGILSTPSPRWTIANYAIQVAGAVAVPIFPNISEENFLYEVKETGLKHIFVEHLQPIAHCDKHADLFKNVIEMSEWIAEPGCLTFDQLIARGKEISVERPELYDQLINKITAEDLAAIIYSSATTGLPKGVMLTQKNLHAHMYEMPIALDETTRYLSILPLAHIFGYSLNILHLGYGASIYYFNDHKNIGKACKEIHPTVVAVVPRLLEKIYARILAGLQEASYMKRQLGQWAFDMANHDHDTLLDPVFRPLADKLVYSRIRESLGGELIAMISGGAPLDPHLNNFYQRVGIPVFEGWGMTEACPITVNEPEHNKVGTVGRVFDGFEIKTSPEGEILVKGTGVMKGYYKNPELTAKALDSEGWLHTGDKGVIDAEGFLTIIGRIKELYKTSTGEYIAPVPIEQEICKAPLIEMAMIIAEGRKYVSALLFPNQEILESLKAAHNNSQMSNEEFLNSPFVRNEMDKLFDELNKHHNHWEQVRAYCFVPHPPSIEEGEMTPSMKLRRDVIIKKYAHLIDALYPQEATV